ncbi:site-specific DNA-methyltransferase [Candidatus Albibeggiatoa sp. nov. BB20]|uniref:site-specific DNA-methyltransferase n=1 Tax=Candidatus Albibeggiatoa sp. nov. BB20 TaxID=3162723 RepID=UPI0033654C40
MATGIPTPNLRKKNKIELNYEGKRSAVEILSPIQTNIDLVYESHSLNQLYFGDNFEVLHHLIQDPQICGKVKLIYIDPPFSTQTTFYSRQQKHAYTDNFNHAEYVQFLRERLFLLHYLLADDGSIYVHLDEKMVFEIKIIMDEIFGSANYRNLIVRKKCNPKNYTRKTYGNISDFILFYTKSEKYIWNRPVEPLSAESQKEYQYTEPETGRKFMKVPIHAPGSRNGDTGKSWRGQLPPPGKHWQYTPKKLDEMDARGEIYWSKNGNPRRKVYLDTHLGVGIQDIWLDFKDAHNQNIKITGYPTEKNQNLLKRIISASSNQDDLVLDCFAGSGTTLAVADELERNWIGVDNSPEALQTILKRFRVGLQKMGDFVEKQASSQISLFDNEPDLFESEPLIDKFSLFSTTEDKESVLKLTDIPF